MSLRLPLLAAALALLPDAGRADILLKCAATPGCSVVRQVDAGRDQSGHGVTITEFRFEQPRSWAVGLECLAGFREFWSESGGVESFITDLCDTSNQHSGGSETAEITTNRLLKSSSGGAGWDWITTTTYQLSPPLVLAESWAGTGPSGDFVQGRWDWLNFSAGTAEEWTALCTADGKKPETVPAADDVPRYSIIPQLHRESVPENLADAELGTCALQLQFSPLNGFMTDGDPRMQRWPGPPWLRVLAYDPDVLMVTTALWQDATDVSVEIWQRPYVERSEGDTADCAPRDQPVLQWTVNIMDGRISAPDGDLTRAPMLLNRHAEIDADGIMRTTMTLRLTDFNGLITVALAGADEANGWKAWRLASSRLVPGDPRSLGQTLPLDSENVSCGLVDGRFDVLRWGAPIGKEEKEGRW